MPCSSPIWIVNRRFIGNSASKPENNILIKPWLTNSYYIPVPCGKCQDCLREKRNNWYVRLNREYAYQHSLGNDCWFVTFTINPRYYVIACNSPAAYIRRIFETIRHRFGSSVRHFLVCEFGADTRRLHFHALLFGPGLQYKDLHDLFNPSRTNGKGLGYIWIKRTDTKNIRYTTKYILKDTGTFYFNQLTAGWSPEQIRQFNRIYVSAGIGDYIGNFPRPSSSVRIWTFLDRSTGISYRYTIPRYYLKYYTATDLQRREIISAMRMAVIHERCVSSETFLEPLQGCFRATEIPGFFSIEWASSILRRLRLPSTPFPTLNGHLILRLQPPDASFFIIFLSMSKTPFISHSINGYSRFEQPVNVGFTATGGILYPANTIFLNANDCINVQCGAVVRANPTVVPTFTPYQVRLHRFFIPMQLYHPEMRVNSSGFDMNNLSVNYLNIAFGAPSLAGSAVTGEVYVSALNHPSSYIIPGSLLDCLDLAHGGRSFYPSGQTSSGFAARLWSGKLTRADFSTGSGAEESASSIVGRYVVNADPVLGYWDTIRNYYSFSQNGIFSFCQRGTTASAYASSVSSSTGVNVPDLSGQFNTAKPNQYWFQYLGSLQVLDDFYETSFYPKPGSTGAFDYTYFFNVILSSAAANPSTINTSVDSPYTTTRLCNVTNGTTTSEIPTYASAVFTGNWPLAVAPSSPDRFSRLLDPTAAPAVPIAGLSTVTQLAVAARLQEYRDLLGAGGSRFSDWLQTFFAAKVNHVDRPLLVYSSSFYLNSGPIFNQQGSPGEGLGEYGGVIQGQDTFGKKSQRYCFSEPGYLMDIFSIRPLYYWSGIQADYARYVGLDYFNPIFNEVGYQTLPSAALSFSSRNTFVPNAAYAKEPCFNEFRSSYDRVFGDFEIIPSLPDNLTQPNDVLTSWVMQRSAPFSIKGGNENSVSQAYRNLSYFTELATVNRPFDSSLEDNFFVNLYYRISRKTLVSKNFATRLATR